MPATPRTGRCHPIVARIVAVLVVALAALAGVAAAPAAHAEDDYPYSGLGDCPRVPLPPPAAPPVPAPAPGPDPAPGTTPAPAPPASPTPVPDPGAPLPGQCSDNVFYYNGTYADPWGFALRHCTSFVAWRLRETNGIVDFDNAFGGRWGNAMYWDDQARVLGYLVDDVPAIGAVAQTDEGVYGHVAWVTGVGEGTVTIEEYNYLSPGQYSVRTVPTTDFRYLHLADLAPAPQRGSTRETSAVLDDAGRSWTARTTDTGDLLVRGPDGRERRIGPAGAWAPYAAPTLAGDAAGRVWLAATRLDGRIASTHTRERGWSALTHVPGDDFATTASPALVEDGDDLRLVAVSATGDLRDVRRRADGWARPERMGLPGWWSTTSAPAAVRSRSGRIHVAAVTKTGDLLLRSTSTNRRSWQDFRTVPGPAWSATSSPALAVDVADRVWVHGVTTHGRLLVRRTRASSQDLVPAGRATGRWSTYASPTVGTDRHGTTWLAGVTRDGALGVRRLPAGATRWTAIRFPAGARADVVTAPALVPTARGRMQLAAAGRAPTLLPAADRRREAPPGRRIVVAGP